METHTVSSSPYSEDDLRRRLAKALALAEKLKSKLELEELTNKELAKRVDVLKGELEKEKEKSNKFVASLPLLSEKLSALFIQQQSIILQQLRGGGSDRCDTISLTPTPSTPFTPNTPIFTSSSSPLPQPTSPLTPPSLSTEVLSQTLRDARDAFELLQSSLSQSRKSVSSNGGTGGAGNNRNSGKVDGGNVIDGNTGMSNRASSKRRGSLSVMLPEMVGTSLLRKSTEFDLCSSSNGNGSGNGSGKSSGKGSSLSRPLSPKLIDVNADSDILIGSDDGKGVDLDSSALSIDTSPFSLSVSASPVPLPLPLSPVPLFPGTGAAASKAWFSEDGDNITDEDKNYVHIFEHFIVVGAHQEVDMILFLTFFLVPQRDVNCTLLIFLYFTSIYFMQNRLRKKAY